MAELGTKFGSRTGGTIGAQLKCRSALKIKEFQDWEDHQGN